MGMVMNSLPAERDRTQGGLEALLRSERPRLYGIAYSILRDHGHAEDALQEAMVKAWRSWDEIRDETAARAWLTRITVNQCINRRKFHRLREALRLDREHDRAGSDPRLTGRLADLDAAYRTLSVQQRSAILLHHYYGYSVDECAGLMNCSAGSVRTHLHRAHVRLRKEMKDA